MRNIIFALLMVLFSRSPMALEQTKTGFVYPIGTSEFPPTGGTWLGRDVDNEPASATPHYFKNFYHNGVDMVTGSLEAKVYAIADGTIYKRHCSDDSWGLGNCALFIRHVTSTGQVFTALYGHLRTQLDTSSPPVKAGDSLGTTGPWSDGIHLHFGIFLGDSPPVTIIGVRGWGMMNNSQWTIPCEGNVQCTNGFLSPIAFIQNNAPSLTRKMYVYKTIGWYPFVDVCTQANQWFRLTPKSDGTYTGIPADVSICAEVPPACFKQP